MTSPSTTADVLAPPKGSGSDNYLTHEKGFLSWALTLDHKRIGVMYLASVLCAFALGGFFALVLRTELFTAERGGGARLQSILRISSMRPRRLPGSRWEGSSALGAWASTKRFTMSSPYQSRHRRDRWWASWPSA